MFVDGFGGGGSAAEAGFMEEPGVVATIVTVFEEDRLEVGMAMEYANGFGAAVAAESNNSYGDWHEWIIIQWTA